MKGSTTVIGLYGLPGSGKSTIAKLLAERVDGQIVSVGMPVKQYSAKKRGYDVELALTQEGKNAVVWTPHDTQPVLAEPHTVRELLQIDALEYRTLYGATAHVDEGLESMPRRLGSEVFIVDDIRTPEEIAAIHRRFPGDAYFVRVQHHAAALVLDHDDFAEHVVHAPTIETLLAGPDNRYLFCAELYPLFGIAALTEVADHLVQFFSARL